MLDDAEHRLKTRYWFANILIIAIGATMILISLTSLLQKHPIWRDALRTVGLSAGLFVIENFILYEFRVYNLTIRRPDMEVTKFMYDD